MRYEIKKLLLRKELWIVVGLSFLALILLSIRSTRTSFAVMRFSQQKTSEYYQIPLDEADAAISAELAALGTDAADFESPDYPYWRVLHEMQRSIGLYQKQESKIKNLLQNMYRDLDRSDGFSRRDLAYAIRLYNRKITYRVCNSDSLEFALMGMDANAAVHGLFLLILCTVLSPLFTAESETGMAQILYPSGKGKKGLFRQKISGGLCCAALFAYSYTFLAAAIRWCQSGLSIRLLSAPIQCAESMQNCPYALSVLDFLFLIAAMRTLIGAFMLALISLLSCFFRKTIIVFGASGGIAVLPLLLQYWLADHPGAMLFLKRLGLMRLSVMRDYLAHYDTVNVGGYPVAQLWLSAACTFGIIIILLAAADYFFIGKRVKSCSASRA